MDLFKGQMSEKVKLHSKHTHHNNKPHIYKGRGLVKMFLNTKWVLNQEMKEKSAAIKLDHLQSKGASRMYEQQLISWPIERH